VEPTAILQILGQYESLDDMDLTDYDAGDPESDSGAMDVAITSPVKRGRAEAAVGSQARPAKAVAKPGDKSASRSSTKKNRIEIDIPPKTVVLKEDELLTADNYQIMRSGLHVTR
jgi:hypothetical protein